MGDELDYGSDHSINGDDEATPKNATDIIIDRKERIATEKAFGITNAVEKHLVVVPSEKSALWKELGVTNEDCQLDTVYVYGVESMSEFDISRIFADFRPEKVLRRKNVAIVQFPTEDEAAAMMLNMSKMMRRVRGRKVADEDGEVMSDDDDVEEGQIMQEKNDDVELVEGLKPNEKGIVTTTEDEDFITVDISARSVPDGKWRVLTKHVAAKLFVIVRFATYDELDEMDKPQSDVKRIACKRERPDFWSHEGSNRGGLNVFDKDGKELEWDYEHDTRFYDDEKQEEKVEKVNLPKSIKIKGRGSVKCGFLFGEGNNSLACDDASPVKRRKSNDEKNYEKDDVVSRMGTAAHAVRPGRMERPMRERIRFPKENDD